MSAGTVLLSESLVSYVSPVSSPMSVHWNGGVIRSTCHHFSQSPRLHVHSECPLMQRCHQRSSVSHCQVSVSCIQQCPLNGAARLDHQSTATSHLQCFTHTHTHTRCTMRNGAAIKIHQSQHCLVNSPFVYTMKGDITHRWPLRSHTNSPSWWFTHACSKPLAQSSETTGAITIGLPNIPVLCTVNSLLVPSPPVRHRLTHTPWSAKDAVHSPVSVRTTLWLPNRRQHPHSLMLNATGQALSPHTPHGQLKDAVHSPASVRTILWLPNPGQHSYCC